MTDSMTPEVFAARPLSVRVAREPDGLVRIALGGEIDIATAGQARAAIEDALLGYEPSRVDLDLSGVSFLDSTGINMMMALHRAAAERGCRLTASRPQRQVARVLALVGVEEHLGLALG
jgi:anti-sigma B factor antagonist